MQYPEHYPLILTEMAQLIRLRLAGSLPDAQADRLARACADDIGFTYSGVQIYFPKQDAARRAARNEEIWRAFNGGNHLDLARRFRITPGQIYEIVKRMRRTHPIQAGA